MGRLDSFDLLRLIAAMMVLFSHQYALNGFVEPKIPYFGTFGGVGVLIFFSLSGYLNCLSIFRSRSTPTFLVNRALRIIPGALVCSAFCVILGAVLTTYGVIDYFLAPAKESYSPPATIVFFIKNAFPVYRIGTDLPGVFADNHLKTIVNGSLWTLPYEIKCYLFLALASLAITFNRAIALRALVAITICLVVTGTLFSFDAFLTKELTIRFLAAFGMGATVALIEYKFGFWTAMAFSLIVPFAFAMSSNHLMFVLTSIASFILFIGWIGTIFNIHAPKIDISYGIYIYAWPVQQTVSNMGMSWSLNFITVVSTTVALGFLSAILVERPALRWKRTSTAATNNMAVSLPVDAQSAPST